MGVIWEAGIIRQLLYDAGAISDKFVPVLFSDASSKHIPTPIRGWTRYIVDTEDGYEELYRRLTAQPRLMKQPIGQLDCYHQAAKARGYTRSKRDKIAPFTSFAAVSHLLS